MLHTEKDRISLELARAIAERLPGRPELIELARENLRRWQDRNADSPRLLACYAEWSAILERPIEEVAELLVDPSDEGQRLRQSSPFAGALSPSEVWAIKGWGAR